MVRQDNLELLTLLPLNPEGRDYRIHQPQASCILDKHSTSGLHPLTPFFLSSHLNKGIIQPGMVVLLCYSSTKESEAGALQVTGQPGLHGWDSIAERQSKTNKYPLIPSWPSRPLLILLPPKSPSPKSINIWFWRLSFRINLGGDKWQDHSVLSLWLKEVCHVVFFLYL